MANNNGDQDPYSPPPSVSVDDLLSAKSFPNAPKPDDSPPVQPVNYPPASPSEDRGEWSVSSLEGSPVWKNIASRFEEAIPPPQAAQEVKKPQRDRKKSEKSEDSGNISVSSLLKSRVLEQISTRFDEEQTPPVKEGAPPAYRENPPPQYRPLSRQRTVKKSRSPVIVETPISGIEKGCFYYTDEFNELVAYNLASLPTRIWGALIDVGVVTFVVMLAIWIKEYSGKGAIKDTLPQSVEEFFRIFNRIETMQQAALWFLVMFVPASLVYHFFSMALNARTLGHALTDSKVVKLDNHTIGIRSACLRSAYGALPQVLIILLLAFLPGWIAFGLGLLVGILTGAGLLTALTQPDKQGLHDKLAETYVIDTKQVAPKFYSNIL